MSAAGEWRQSKLEEVISLVSDVFSGFQHSQAGEVDSIPIARSKYFLLCNQHKRLVMGGLCSPFRPQSSFGSVACYHPFGGIFSPSGEWRGECCLRRGMGDSGEMGGEIWVGIIGFSNLLPGSWTLLFTRLRRC